MSNSLIPLTNVTLYSSGVAYYEHSGTLNGNSRIDLSFSPSQINDVLKSLVVVDSAAKKFVVSYQSEDSLEKILESLSVNISQGLDLADILNKQKGAEIEVVVSANTSAGRTNSSASNSKIIGKILSVDKNKTDGSASISLSCKDGINIIPMNTIKSFRFTDEKRNEDLNTALNLILNASSSTKKHISIDIEANAKRNVKLAYVMEAPVWKPTYRINMNDKNAEFQAWAIVDNSTDIDWKNIRLTLTTGRPVGFKQDLYPPYYTYRPTLPLKVAGIASADTFESAYDEEDVYEMEADAVAEVAPRMMAKTAATGAARANATKNESFMNVNQTVTTSAVQDEMFSFTPVNPVTINRQESIMIPLVVNAIPAEKFSVFSNMTLQKEVHPKLCIRIENKTDMKFPAGPVSVLSSGTYSGDAMLDFLPAGEKRIIGFGDDMEVNGSLTRSTERNVETVKIINGMLKITTRRNYDSVYTIKNASAISKSIIVEHPITNGRELLNSKDVFEKTANKYRFKIEVAQKQNKKITVQEKESAESSYALSRMSYADFISYSTNSEMPSKVKKTFSEIASRKSKVENARSEFNKLVEEQKNLSIEQERVRKNLEALGSASVQGKQFLDKLMSLENELDLLKKKIAQAQENLSKLEKDFSDYIAKVSV